MPEPTTAPSRWLHVARFLARLIVNLSFLGVSEAGIGCTNFFEGFACLRCPVLVGMQLYGVLFVGLLDFFLASVSRHTQDVIVVLFCKNFSANLNLCCRVLRSLRLRGLRLCFFFRSCTTLSVFSCLLLLITIPSTHRVKLIEHILSFLILSEFHCLVEKALGLLRG